MKLNNKGVTIIELIVSIALISVVMLFMYRLLADVTFQKDNDYFASVNQEQRIEIIDKLETHLSSNSNIKSVTVSGRNIYFKNSYGSTLSSLRVEAVSGTYKVLTLYNGSSTSSILNRWNIKGGTLDNVPYCYSRTGGGKTIVECTIEVYTTNTNNKYLYHNGKAVNNNNTVDDIVFSIMY